MMLRTIEENNKRILTRKIEEKQEKEEENRLFEHYNIMFDEKQRQREEFSCD